MPRLSAVDRARVRACAASLRALAESLLAPSSADTFTESRIRLAVSELASASKIATVSGIRYSDDVCTTRQAKIESAIACIQFADNPSVLTWLQVDRWLTTLDHAWQSLHDRATKPRLLSMTATLPDPNPPPIHRMHSDDVRALHAGSAGTAKIKPNDCPPTFESSADERELRAIRAEKHLARVQSMIHKKLGTKPVWFTASRVMPSLLAASKRRPQAGLPGFHDTALTAKTDLSCYKTGFSG